MQRQEMLTTTCFPLYRVAVPTVILPRHLLRTEQLKLIIPEPLHKHYRIKFQQFILGNQVQVRFLYREAQSVSKNVLNWKREIDCNLRAIK